jgi:cytochrome c oxidase assembly factor CtaG
MPSQAVLAPVLLAAYAAPYAWRARTLRRRGRPVPPWRIACFAGAVALLALAVSPWADRLADTHLSDHMIEHLIIGDLAPLLAVLGCTGPLLAPLLRMKPVERLRFLSHPVVAFALWAADLYLWHLPFAYQAALRHDVVHVLQHACFFAFGFNLWLPLFGPLPKPAWFGNGARLVYVVAVRVAGFALGNALTWAHVEFYPYYGHSLGDQSAAGAVMMLEQMVVMLGLFAWLFARVLREAEERQSLAELATAQGVAVDEERIARAVGAGQSERLRNRLANGAMRDTPVGQRRARS